MYKGFTSLVRYLLQKGFTRLVSADGLWFCISLTV